jgi:hypothetical protein
MQIFITRSCQLLSIIALLTACGGGGGGSGSTSFGRIFQRVHLRMASFAQPFRIRLTVLASLIV